MASLLMIVHLSFRHAKGILILYLWLAEAEGRGLPLVDKLLMRISATHCVSIMEQLSIHFGQIYFQMSHPTSPAKKFPVPRNFPQITQQMPSQVESEGHQESKSRWSLHLNWLTTKINKICEPLKMYCGGGEDEPRGGRHWHGEDGNERMDGGKRVIKVVDPKTKVLRALRKGNLKPAFQEKIKRAHKFFSKKEESMDKPCDLLCPICLQFFIKPVTTVCGHNFCMRCLDETLLFKPECPNCRHFIRGTKFIKCESLHKLTLRIIEKYPEEEIELYKQTLREAVEWLESRSLDPESIQIGQIIDAKDTQYIWCKAKITQIYHKNNVAQSIKIHYFSWNSIYDQIIQISSERLAKEGFYTNRLDIPRYKYASSDEERMYNYVVTSENDFLNVNVDVGGDWNGVGSGHGLGFGMGAWNGLEFGFGNGVVDDDLYDADPLVDINGLNLESIQELSLEYANNDHPDSQNESNTSSRAQLQLSIQSQPQQSQPQPQPQPNTNGLNRIENLELQVQNYSIYLNNLLQSFSFNSHGNNQSEQEKQKEEEKRGQGQGENPEKEEESLI